MILGECAIRKFKKKKNCVWYFIMWKCVIENEFVEKRIQIMIVEQGLCKQYLKRKECDKNLRKVISFM